jgi:hypothetical protein
MKNKMRAARIAGGMAVVLTSLWGSLGVGQESHAPSLKMQPTTSLLQETTMDQENKASALLQLVRNATERFKDVATAEAEGYQLTFGCVSGPDAGAMGMHFVNFDLVGKGELDATRPQIVIYEPTASGRLQLVGADFLVIAEQWDKAHNGAPPQLMGQLFHYFEAPNRFGLPAFYTLHVWAWKANPNGAFVNWHPNVSCQAFSGQTP